MCKYCDCKEIVEGYEKEGQSIAEGRRSACCIVQPAKSPKYYIAVVGDSDDFWQYDYDEPISFCPFCGRKLKD